MPKQKMLAPPQATAAVRPATEGRRMLAPVTITFTLVSALPKPVGIHLHDKFMRVSGTMLADEHRDGLFSE